MYLHAIVLRFLGRPVHNLVTILAELTLPLIEVNKRVLLAFVSYFKEGHKCTHDRVVMSLCRSV
jgi:hypothetical protein